MDFDDLDDAEETFGPTPEDIRDDLMSKQNPSTMPGARQHPKPDGRGFGGGHMKKQKMLYLHGNGSNAKLGRSQVNAVFKNLSTFSDFEFDFLEGAINFKLEEIHSDPAVAQLFVPYGNKCGETYDGYLSYVYLYSESHNDETWLGPSHDEENRSGASCSSEGCGYEEVLHAMADQLNRNGPYDGIVAFDVGACLALEAARLAQEEDPRFMKTFRYLVLFSARGHRELAKYKQGRLRPKAPLQVPALLAWSEEDDSKQYSNYEDAALYFHPDCRCILKHDQGHRPPNLQKGAKALEVLEKFLGDMQVNLPHIQDTRDEASSYKDYWLPLQRVVGPGWTGAQRKLVIVGDPLGVHGPMAEDSFTERLRFPAQEHPEICARRLELYRMVTGTNAADFSKVLAETEGGSDVEVVNVTYANEHQTWDWHPKVEAKDVSVAYAPGQGRSRWLQAEDEICISWAQMKYLAEELLETMNISREDDIAIVGLGTGAHVAVALALAVMRSKHIVPKRLFCVAPPTVWPVEDAPGMGALANAPVRYLTYAESVAGPPWRLETSTFGPFSHSHFHDKQMLLKLIVDEVCSSESQSAHTGSS